MRSVVLAGFVLLAGCQQAEQAPAEPSQAAVASEAVIDASGSPRDPVPPQPPLPPTLPGDLNKVPNLIPADGVVKSKHFQALGTEPFWGLEVLSGKLIYTSPEVQLGIAVNYTFSSEGKATRYSGTLQGKPMALTIAPGTCSDGMSDTVYPYKAEFKWGDATQQGCARLK
jgi:uncharacterized membrane protein